MIGRLFVQPVVGCFSDKIGRKPFLLVGSLGLLALSVPAFHFIGSDNAGLIFLGLLFIAVLLNCLTGVMASTLPALFPTRIRYSALASSFRSEEHTSELQSLMRIPYAVLCLKKKKN